MPHQPLKRPRSPNALSARSLVILFLATLSVSFMLLLVLFQVVFKNIHLQFNTRTPETAPTLTGQSAGLFQGEAPMFQRMGVQSASVQTPGRSGRGSMAIPSEKSGETPSPSLSTEPSALPVEALPTLPPLNSSSSSKNAPLPLPKPLPSKTPLFKPVTPEPSSASEEFELE